MASKKMQISLPEQTIEKLEEICERRDLKKSTVIGLALFEYYKKVLAEDFLEDKI